MSKKSLIVVEQKTVDFYNDELVAARADDGNIYVSIRHMCQALGVDRRGQMRRIRDHAVLAEGYTRGGLISPPSSDGRGGGLQQASLLRVDLVPLWLSGISPNRVKGDIQEKLIRFQRESAQVLWEAFQAGRLTSEPDFTALLEQNTPEVQAYKMLVGMAQLAQQQILLRSQVNTLEMRLEVIETELGHDDRLITRSQAMEISQGVKVVAMEMSKRSGRNEYGGVYGELYRRFEITSYKEIPASRFEEAMNFLTDWHNNLVGDEPF